MNLFDEKSVNSEKWPMPRFRTLESVTSSAFPLFHLHTDNSIPFKWFIPHGSSAFNSSLETEWRLKHGKIGKSNFQLMTKAILFFSGMKTFKWYCWELQEESFHKSFYCKLWCCCFNNERYVSIKWQPEINIRRLLNTKQAGV